jgi:hypothetical protein
VGKMLIDTVITIAYKCPLCGSFKFFNISLFVLQQKKEFHLKCRCKKSNLVVMENGSKAFEIRTPCIGCGYEHIYNLDRKEFLNKEISVFHCPSTGMQQCFVGRDEAVRKKVDSVERELDELMDMFGYDNYFDNTQVMFDSLNRIHDIAEQGNLYCECGSSDVELILLPNKICLKCNKCSGSRIIQAASNEDLKDILIRQQILLLKELPDHEPTDANTFLEHKNL